MKKKDRLVYCKKCTHRKMDLNIGILCGITNKVADFENTCSKYEIDEQIKLEEINISNQIRPNKKRAEYAKILIAIIIVLEVVSGISSYTQLNLLNIIKDGGQVSINEANVSDSRKQIISIIYIVFYIISVITFLNWFRRAYYNLNIRSRCEFSDNQALFSWFIPFINMYRPFQIMKEMWLHTSELIIAKSNKKNKNGNGIIIFLWWILWIFSNFIGNYITRNLFKQEGIINLINTIKAEISLGIIGFTLAIITYIMIDKYSQKEEILRKLEKEIS